MRTGRPRTAPESRFFAKVRQSGDCWEWTGTTNNGYGHFWTGDSRVYAHRLAFEFLRDEIPADLQIDHLCRNRLCVNPWHMEPVTARINTLRGSGVTARLAVLTHCKHGHEFTPQNTIRIPQGRQCRTCRRAIEARYRARKKESA